MPAWILPAGRPWRAVKPIAFLPGWMVNFSRNNWVNGSGIKIWEIKNSSKLYRKSGENTWPMRSMKKIMNVTFLGVHCFDWWLSLSLYTLNSFGVWNSLGRPFRSIPEPVRRKADVGYCCCILSSAIEPFLTSRLKGIPLVGGLFLRRSVQIIIRPMPRNILLTSIMNGETVASVKLTI